MTKGVFRLQQILKLQQKLVPEFIELLQKRYNILRTIYYNQPIGRRILANNLGIGERVVRSEISFLKEQKLIEVNTPGMSVTEEGEEILNSLKEIIHELKGLTEIEEIIKTKLNLREVIVVPGNVSEDPTVMNEIGRVSALYLKSILTKDDTIIALTGGSSVKALVDNFPKTASDSNMLVVPARGGMGRDVELQANTLTASLANKLKASYRLLHVPDKISNDALNMMLKEKEVNEIVEDIRKANILIYGIGSAHNMALRRGLSDEMIEKLNKLGAVGEAFGYYFNQNGEIVYSTPTIGVNHEDMKNFETLIAVAGGRNKAKAIIATERSNFNSVLITDEGAAKEIVNLL